MDNTAINHYYTKGIDGATAGLLYNLGVEHGNLNDDPGNADDGATNFLFDGNNYDLTDAGGLQDFVEEKAQAINPFTDGV